MVWRGVPVLALAGSWWAVVARVVGAYLFLLGAVCRMSLFLCTRCVLGVYSVCTRLPLFLIGRWRLPLCACLFRMYRYVYRYVFVPVF